MRKRLTRFALMGVSAVCAALAANAQTMPDKTIFGLTTTGELVRFKSSTPGKLVKIPKLSGLQTGEKLVGIDFRPANKMLYGATDRSRLYTINTTTGAATLVGTLTTTLSAGPVGFDFNPVPDRLRINNDADQNLRANPADAVNVVDKPLTFNAADANNGKNAGVAAAAYTNNFAGTKATTLYCIDAALDVLLTQNPPNDGVLNTVGPLGVNTTGNAGFDVVTEGERNIAFAALQIDGESRSRFYSVNLTSGAATLIGRLGAKDPLVGIAMALD